MNMLETLVAARRLRDMAAHMAQRIETRRDAMQIGRPQREIIVEPLEIPAPLRTTEAEPQQPQRQRQEEVEPAEVEE